MSRPDILGDRQYLELKPEDLIILDRKKPGFLPDLPAFNRAIIYLGRPIGTTPASSHLRTYMELQLENGQSSTYCLDRACSSLEVILIKP